MNRLEKKSGLIAGISLLVMAVAAGFSYGFVQNELVDASAEITRQNLAEHKSLFLAGLAGWFVIFVADLAVTWALYIFFRESGKRTSMATAIVRLVYTLVLGVAIFQLLAIVPETGNANAAAVIDSRFTSFENIWSAGLVIFGLHLLGLGYLSLKSKHIPGFFGYLLYLAGVSYVVVHASEQFNLLSDTAIGTLERILTLPMALGELLLAVWLIIIAVRKRTVS